MDNIIILIIMFAVGLVLIVKGADWLTEGVSSIARRFRISSLVIGLTIVALGTSMPEMVVSLFSAIEGKTSMAIGNVVGWWAVRVSFCCFALWDTMYGRRWHSSRTVSNVYVQPEQ